MISVAQKSRTSSGVPSPITHPPSTRLRQLAPAFSRASSRTPCVEGCRPRALSRGRRQPSPEGRDAGREVTRPCPAACCSTRCRRSLRGRDAEKGRVLCRIRRGKDPPVAGFGPGRQAPAWKPSRLRSLETASLPVVAARWRPRYSLRRRR
jgi:hypothetical protein